MKMNKVYNIDNLKLLYQIPDNYIDLIYCDILYGTGTNFKEYKDLKPKQDIINDFYIERLNQIYRVLKPTGTLYLQMGWNINHWIRLILDNIFGYSNLINEIIILRNCGIKTSKHKQINIHDTILHYSKTNEYIHNIIYKPYTDHQYNRFQYKDDKGYYYLDTRRNKNGTRIRKKVYRKEGIQLGDVWDFSNDSTKNYTYPTQKPLELLKQIIKISSNPNDIVADFFCGSGTTLVAARQLGRRYIGCDINENAINITKKRLSNVISTIDEFI